MKILYAIQGTGNGHVARAREIIPFLQKHGDLDLLISGTQAEVNLEDEVKYRFNGFGFVFGKNGGVDFRETWQRFDTAQFIKDVKNLPVKSYDLVINDFEPVCAWACKWQGKKSISLSHQSAYKSKKTPQLSGFHWGRVIMNNYAPTNVHIAFHFQRFDDFIHTPVIRSEIRNLQPENLGHYTVYLPAYSDEFILNQVKKFPQKTWHIFSKHNQLFYTKDNAKIFPIDNSEFQKSLASCEGFLTGGGFEGPAEALFLKKKLLSVPMKNQYEQQCNALALEKMGVPVIWNEEEFAPKLKLWVEQGETVPVDFPNETEQIIADLVRNHKF
ncbi:MAG: glycosyltransferase family protein [Cruoricaptor ignavus]|nr:glycosyltransferase family protein [Cruoricaptor ignavus]